MTRRPFYAVCAAICTASACGQRVEDFTIALDQAKATKSDIAVFIHGSDWNRPSEAAAKIWKDPRFLSGIGAGVVLLDIDRKENPTEAEKVFAKRNEKGDPAVRSVPAVALYDSEGRLVGSVLGQCRNRGGGRIVTGDEEADGDPPRAR